MRCITWLLVWLFCGSLGIASLEVSAQQPPSRCEVLTPRTNVSVQIVSNGYPKPVYYDGSYRWIEGRPGERFVFQITNHNGFAVGVIPSADGHSLTSDGRASASHPAYLIEPYGTITVSIWRETLAGGRELFFTSVDNSLAARKGDRRNIGVLGVLVWQLEDRAQIIVPNRKDGRGEEKSKAGAPAAGDSDQIYNSQGIGVGAGQYQSDQAALTDRYRRIRILGTISIYYDDYDGLIRAGVPVQQPYPLDRRRSNPFPGEYKGVRIP